jgi:Tol biopolymer transport system component
VVVALLVLPVAMGGCRHARPSPRARGPGRVVFLNDRDGRDNIYAVNPDGTGMTRLTNKSDEGLPLPSPDGTLIAVAGEKGLTVMNADGSDARPLRGCYESELPSWSPDSGSLACEAAGAAGLIVVDAKSGEAKHLADKGTSPAWSPDGQLVAFIDRDDESLWVVAAKGGAARRLSDDAYGELTWSPDSHRIAYSGFARGGLFTVRTDGSAERRIAKGDIHNPRWSPTGSLIAFERGSGVYVVRADGSGLRRISISAGGESSSSPAWSPDGGRLVYVRARYSTDPSEGYEGDLVAVSPGTGVSRALTRPFPVGGSSAAPQWAPGVRLTTLAKAPPPTIVLPRPQLLTVPAPARFVAERGRAVSYTGSCEGAQVWEPRERRTTRTPRLCEDFADGVMTLTLAGDRLAWSSSYSSNYGEHMELWTLRLGGRPEGVASALEAEDPADPSASFPRLLGGGGTIVFTLEDHHGRITKHSAWELLHVRGRRCPAKDWENGGPSAARCRLVPGAVNAVSVDAGRALTLEPGGIVRLVAMSGRVLHRWSLGAGVNAALLDGRTVAVQRGKSVFLFDAGTGAKTRMRRFAADEGGTRLLDIHGNLVAYSTAGAIHLLRVSDGRDRALALPRAAPPFNARLDASGLFVSWNRMYDRRPGRIAFVPLRTLERALAR